MPRRLRRCCSGWPSAAPGASALWSPEPIGAGAFAAMNGAVTFKLDRAALTPALVARDLKGVLRLQPSQITFGDIDGSLAGGRLTGELAVRSDAQKLALRGSVALAGAHAAALLPASNNAIDGLITLKLQGDSLGLSPDGLVGALHGNGTIALSEAHFAGVDVTAFDAAMRAADQSGSAEAPKIRAAVSAAMDNGRLAVPQGNAEVTVAAGQIHLTKASWHAQNGAEVSVDGMLDLNDAAIDAHLTLSVKPAANALIPGRPELTVAVKGPLTAPERRLDVSTLVAWLTLRAAELQTRRVELLEANRREDVRGPVVRPASPAIRFIPTGTALETIDHAGASASALSGRTFDRLQPEIPVPMPMSRPGAAAAPLPPANGIKPAAPHPATAADKTTANAGTPIRTAGVRRRRNPRCARRSICYSTRRTDAGGGGTTINSRGGWLLSQSSLPRA